MHARTKLHSACMHGTVRQGKMLEKREAALALAASLSQQVRAGRHTRTSPRQHPQLPRTRLSRRVDASSCWSTNKSTWPLAKCAGKTVDKSLPNACPHACFAAYAWPAADLARPCAPFRSTQCNVPAGTACRASRCVLKPTSQRLTFEHSKKRWKMVLIYSQHIWFFFVFFWGDVTVSSLFKLSRDPDKLLLPISFTIYSCILCVQV